MKYLILFLCFSLLTTSYTAEVAYPRGCIYIDGRCHEECPVGTHAYAIGCGYVTPEATCKNPHPAKGTSENGGMICDFSACYCDLPTVRDEASGKCIALEKCKAQ